MARKKGSLGLIILSLLLICSCYESKFPLSSSDKARTDERLIKSWLEQPQNPDDKPYRVIICKFNDHEYLIGFNNDTKDTATLSRAFTTTIDTTTIMNMQGIEPLAPKDRTFIFFKYAFATNGNLRVWMFSNDSPLLKDRTFSTQAEFYTFIKKNVHNEQLYSTMREFKPVDEMHLKLSGKGNDQE
jgi:hypothetical protein